MSKLFALSLVLGIVATTAAVPAAAQTVPDLLVAPQASSAASRRDVPARRVRKARLNPLALDSATMRLHLFDDVQPTMKRKKLSRPSSDTMVWVGDSENGAQAVLAVVRGVLTGTVFADSRTFEISIDPDGQYSVAELDPGAFPTDDPVVDDVRFEILNVPDGFVEDAASVAAPTVASVLSGTPVQIDVMIVWTPRTEAAAGGQAAMESLALASVENANLVYANSGVNAQLRLVYGAKVNWVETDITNDLYAVRGTGDGKLEEVHTLRTQYGADVVSLIGEGYVSAGACGIGSLMSTVSTSFASNAFNVVDRTCAVGNLSYAHEVGHNEGLHHDPANASSTPSAPYAYGYQDPSGFFRTVMSYGGATRIPYLSSPANQYNGIVTGTPSQDNVRALNATIGTVAAFKSTSGGTTTAPPPAPTPTPCTYSVSTTSLTFPSAGGSKSVTVTAPSGCSWSTANDSASTWVNLNTAGGSGSGSVTVTAAANTGSARSATVTIAGKTVAVSESAVKTRGRK
ncbi:reprolysin-like metallopeptidase [Luteitalea pratensis]|nr:M12 family metallo-peptidase [Luteitalea pratensis]